MQTNLTCGQALMQLVQSYGIDTVFGMPGVHTLEYYRGIGDTDMHHVMFRHEQGGGFMADGFARISGRPAACCVITGPGVTNIATAVGNAYADSSPMLVLASTIATMDLGAGRGRLHEITDQLSTISPMTAFSQTLFNGNQIPSAVAHAFDLFKSSRPRPVHLELPIDVIGQPANFVPKPSTLTRAPRPDPASIERAAMLCSRSKQPVIIAGGGVLDSGTSLVDLAERIGAAVLLTTAAKGIISDTHPLNCGACLSIPVAHRFIAEADLVIAVGTELSETDLWAPRFLEISGKLIRIDIDPANLSRDLIPDVSVLGDGGASLDALTASVGAAKSDFTDGRRVREFRESVLTEIIASERDRRCAKTLDAIRAAIPEDGWLITDATQIAYLANTYYPTSHPRSYTHPSGYCTLGSAMPSAIGACLGSPTRKGAALAGDAGLLFTVQELATAVEERVGLPVIVWNNDGLAQIKHGMLERDIEPLGVDPRNPDYLQIARGFGAEAVSPGSVGELTSAIKDAFEADGPTLIEVKESSDYLQ